MASWAPSLMPSPSAAWPPESGLWEAILMVPLDWASTCAVAGSSRAAIARAVSTWRIRKVLIRCPPQNGSAKCASGAIISGLGGPSTCRARPGRTCAHGAWLGQERLELATRFGVARVDGQRFLEQDLGHQRAARPALLRRARDQGQREVGSQARESRVLGEGLTVVGQGLGVSALLRVHGAQVGQRPGQVGLEPPGEVEHLLRLFDLVLPVKRSRDIFREQGAPWAERG